MNLAVLSAHSDGLGRSGALIATDIARQQLENEQQVNVVDIVTTMREGRGGMISTKEQYAFVYQVSVVDV